jgi:hypothetical protein
VRVTTRLYSNETTRSEAAELRLPHVTWVADRGGGVGDLFAFRDIMPPTITDEKT